MIFIIRQIMAACRSAPDRPSVNVWFGSRIPAYPCAGRNMTTHYTGSQHERRKAPDHHLCQLCPSFFTFLYPPDSASPASSRPGPRRVGDHQWPSDPSAEIKLVGNSQWGKTPHRQCGDWRCAGAGLGSLSPYPVRRSLLLMFEFR